MFLLVSKYSLMSILRKLMHGKPYGTDVLVYPNFSSYPWICLGLHVAWLQCICCLFSRRVDPN